MSFEIKLPLFEGPFDLLLFFIERDELDIYDIPIATINKEFFEYLHRLEKLNIEVASEFILVAATLMRIKAKMLLPRPALDDEGNEVDPREELVRHLLEYKKYKSVVQELSAMEEGRLQKETRGNVAQELKALAEVSDVESELQGLDLYKLLRVYGRVMQKFNLEQEKPLHSVVQFPFTIAGQKEYILQLMTENTKVSFEDIIALIPHRIGVIFNFLAILELLQLRLISLTLGLGFNNFWIERYEEELVA